MEMPTEGRWGESTGRTTSTSQGTHSLTALGQKQPFEHLDFGFYLRHPVLI